MGDLRLLEDGSERRGAHDSDVVAFETAREGWNGDGERAAMSKEEQPCQEPQRRRTVGERFEHERPTAAIAVSSCP